MSRSKAKDQNVRFIESRRAMARSPRIEGFLVRITGKTVFFGLGEDRTPQPAFAALVSAFSKSYGA